MSVIGWMEDDYAEEEFVPKAWFVEWTGGEDKKVERKQSFFVEYEGCNLRFKSLIEEMNNEYNKNRSEWGD